MSYQPVPGEEQGTGELAFRYPPTFQHVPSIASPSTSPSRRRSHYLHLAISFILGGLFLHFIDSRIAIYAKKAAYEQGLADKQSILDIYTPSATTLQNASTQPGGFYRDHTPLRTAMTFYNLAEHEIAQRNDLELCNGQLSKPFIDAYVEQRMSYCQGDGEITCLPMHRAEFNHWWPYPTSPCLSTHLRPVKDQQRSFRAECSVTEDGNKLADEMGGERFLGIEMSWDGEKTRCNQTLDRTVVFIGRQDQWNPFHVAEDLLTTFTTFILATVTSASPGHRSMVDDRIQLIFQEGFKLDANHFTPLWDRIGSWAPRRLSLDPWEGDVCLTDAIHSVGAGASLLSAPPISLPYDCVSSLTWGASHYYRHLFGFPPPSLNPSQRKPINILWLSRAKLDAQAQHDHEWSQWRAIRHINNELDLIARLRNGLTAMCQDGAAFSDEGGCEYEDFAVKPEAWDQSQLDGPRKVRFAHIDPTVHALETQIDFVGHTTILISPHGGALGLGLFMPPGEGAIIELQVKSVQGNWHFQHLAKEKGMGYELVTISATVDVDEVWHKVEQWIATLGWA